MEELQDAIEDAQYVNAISTQEDGPRPVLAWEKPSAEELEKWKQLKRNDPQAFGLEWTCKSALGFFMFSAFLKDDCDDYLRINFVEEVLRWRRKMVKGPRQLQRKVDRAKRIVSRYLEYQDIEEEEEATDENPVATDDFDVNDNTEQTKLQHQLPPKTEIDEYDLERPPSALKLSEDEFDEMCGANIDPSKAACPVALEGPVRDEILEIMLEIDKTQEGPTNHDDKVAQESHNNNNNNVEKEKKRYSSASKSSISLPEDLFDKAEAIVMESLRRDYWAAFVESHSYQKLLNFLWFQDRPIVPEDFFTMRVLGRGGFGLVTGK